ncbi:beta-lactamase hydrolase domain-containing protein [Moraxella sp. ZJ142]|uniref:beta-lactamase hydrolase domain-containing protein n=1 Tax=Moraxella marmotae TaxID=3344520 RepID=UPI0035D42F1A
MHNQITLYKQIHPKQCQMLAKLGFKSLINLRFDAEIDGQPKNSDIADSANDAGLDYHSLPIDIDNIHLAQAQHFAQLIHQAPKPVMVFCGTGARAKRLYQSALILGLL